MLPERALGFARKKHLRQKRAGGSSYIGHLERVALRLASRGFTDYSILSLALLHDTLEDTDTSTDELQREFGQDMARDVQILTLDASRSFDEQACEYFSSIIAAGAATVAVKLADITDNLEDIEGIERDRLRRMLGKARSFLIFYSSDQRERSKRNNLRDLCRELICSIGRGVEILGGPIMIPKMEKCYNLRIASLLETAANELPRNPSGCCCSAAALSASGEVFLAPAESCFANRDIDAVRAAVEGARVYGDLELVAVALVYSEKTKNLEKVSKDCHDFLQSHVLSTGRDILLVNANSTRSLVEFDTITWESSRPVSNYDNNAFEQKLPWRTLPAWNHVDGTLEYGDYVQTKGRYLSMVWAPQWEKGLALLKIRYDGWEDPKKAGQRVCKLPASFTRYDEYLQVLVERKLGRNFPWGEPAYLVSHQEIEGRLPRIRLENLDLAREPIDEERLKPFLKVLREAQIPRSAVTLTGSYSVGLARADSDFDVVICAEVAEVGRLHAAICQAMLNGRFQAPEGSKTWERLEFGGKRAWELVKEGRFAETFSVIQDGQVSKISVIYIHPRHDATYLSGSAEALPVESISGTVIDSSESNFKPGRYSLQADTGGKVEVVCWNKWAGLLKNGDRVRIKAAPCRDDKKILHVQTHPENHSIELL